MDIRYHKRCAFFKHFKITVVNVCQGSVEPISADMEDDLLERSAILCSNSHGSAVGHIYINEL